MLSSSNWARRNREPRRRRLRLTGSLVPPICSRCPHQAERDRTPGYGPVCSTRGSVRKLSSNEAGFPPRITTVTCANCQSVLTVAAIYPEGKLLFAAMPGIQSYMEPPRVFLGMWSLDDDGDVAPKWAIAGDRTTMGKTFGVALNPEHKEVYVSDMRRHGILTYFVPEVFEPVAGVPSATR